MDEYCYVGGNEVGWVRLEWVMEGFDCEVEEWCSFTGIYWNLFFWNLDYIGFWRWIWFV